MRTVDYLAIAFGGAFGSVARAYLVQLLAPYEGKLPLGVPCVNLLGSFLIGVLAGVVLLRGYPSEIWRFGLMLGVLGGFTTFSSFSYEILTLLKNGFLLEALWSLSVQVVGGIVLAGLGFQCTRVLL